MAARSPPLFPERIGRYDVLLPVASGGMGTVYLARATSIGGFEREVAIKLMHAHLKENASFARELVEEAKLTVRIRHPNVVSVIDVGEDPFGVYLVMDYVEGDTLAGLHRRAVASADRRLPVRFGLKLLLDALAGLQAAHELRDGSGALAGLVHRDFSPQNILVGVDGIGRLTDFGIAKAATRISETSTGIIKGKIAYMAPEQTRGAPVDRRTDVWAAGVVAWQIIAGRKLHPTDDNDVATLLRIASVPPPRLREVEPSVPELLDQCVAKALAMNVEDRWPTAQAFKQALQEACRAHGEVAETEEVADFVSRIVEPVILERRARAAEILELRAKMEKLAGAADPSLPTSTPQPRDPEDAPTVLATKPLVAQPPLETTVSVATTSVVETVTARVSRTARTPLGFAMVMVAVVATSALALVMIVRRAQPAVAAPSDPPTTSAAEPSASVAPSTIDPPSAATTEPSAYPVASHATTRSPAPARTVRHAPAPTASDSLLPRSPYEGKR